MTKEGEKQKLQEKYVEFQLLQERIQEVEQQRQFIAQQNNELHKTRDSLSGLSSAHTGEQIFSQIGSGVFIRTKLDEINYVLINIGANIFASKTIEETRTFLDMHIEELENSIGNINNTLEKAANHLYALQEEILRLGKD